MNRIVVAGISTEVGKTVVAAILTEALHGYYWKPIQCGMPQDRVWVDKRLSSKKHCYSESFCLSDPCSPHLAARKEGKCIEAKNLIPPSCSEYLVIEGTGGILAPLNETETWADAAAHWNARWVLVHRHYLGSLNHFFLTVDSMKERKLPLLGVVFNGEGDQETEEMLLKRANTLCLGRLSWVEQWTRTIVQRLGEEWRPTLLEALGL